MYCNSTHKKAIVDYISGDGKKKQQIIESSFPLTITIDSNRKALLKSSGNAPINYTAPSAITSITCTGSFRQIGSRPDTELPCTYILGVSQIEGNRWTAEYDSVYGDNTGNMEFTINYAVAECIIRIRNKEGKLLFKDSGQCPITFTVKCAKDKCPPGYVQCDTPKYPGFCCIPCKETGTKLKNIASTVKY
ncbi:hypothetical protein [Nostoc sp. ChiVER01]|uniref:hypothetical protein n=1 Tax=Nostoc sp. ChiVER01 TaxID=3075382 RepID=UPI002AD4746C|nr:hypothetical protein [Nostoc sp. ChiVER01]MDZ8227529.1 hypothetical protein [Nostoc sp. ChiVER01]